MTGTTPFPKETLDQAGFDEQRRIIRDKEPPRASVRISSLGKTATAIADHRKTDPAKLNQLIRGDLDWILLKALDKDRTRRYGTAVGFAEDVARFLSDEPIIANPPSTRVRLWKFAKRNQFGVVAGTLIGLSLVLAFASITWYSIKLTRLVDDYRFELTEKALIAAFN